MAKTNTEPKAEKVTRITRAQAANNVVAAMTGNTTLSELAKAADAAFVTAGGKSRLGWHCSCRFARSFARGRLGDTSPVFANG